MKIRLVFLLTSLLAFQSYARPLVVSDGVKVDLKENVLPLFKSKLQSRFVFEDDELLNLDEKDPDTTQQKAMFEGDIILLDWQKEVLLSKETDDDYNLGTRTGLRSVNTRWPRYTDGFVYVPYVLSSHAGYTNEDRENMELAMETISEYTIIRFRPRTDEENYLYIFSGSGCYSYLGMIGGRQEISLKKKGCTSPRTVMHELIHSLGFTHMQNHANRDDYVWIQWQNVNQNQRSNFEKVDKRKFQNYGTKYDYYSVMHYGRSSFSTNGADTIIPKYEGFIDIIGEQDGISRGDVDRISRMYDSNE